MAVFDTTRTGFGATTMAGRISGFVNTVIGTVIAWNDARVTRKALSRLTDRELEDIGMMRGDIEIVTERRNRI